MGRDLLTTRSVKTDTGHTTIALESYYWDTITEIIKWEKTTLSEIIRMVDDERKTQSRASALRIFALKYYRKIATPLVVGPLAEWRYPYQDGPNQGRIN
jgi:predicted DNA-binding ribbon-helix-helix protein